jgi:hypothetical protein
MTLKIEAGKRYVDRKGTVHRVKEYPVTGWWYSKGFRYCVDDDNDLCWLPNGKFCRSQELSSERDLVEEYKEELKFKDMKFRVKNEEHFKTILSWLDERGYIDTRLSYSNSYFSFIYTDKQGFIRFGNNEKNFISSLDYTEVEIKYEVVNSYKITSVKEFLHRNIVTIGNRQYYEDELVVAMNNIKPIEVK